MSYILVCEVDDYTYGRPRSPKAWAPYSLNDPPSFTRPLHFLATVSVVVFVIVHWACHIALTTPMNG